jgi:membrane fusion protein, macrolide-specific efflux system
MAQTAQQAAHATSKKGHRRHWLWIALTAVAVVIVLAIVMRPPPPPRLLTAEIVRGALERTVVATGTVEARRLVSVGAQVSGQVKSLNVALGDRVVAGQLIAEIDSTNQRNALRNAEAALANIRAQRAAQQATLVQAEAAFRRQRMMIESDATSRADVDASKASYDAAQAQLRAIDAQIAQGGTSLDTARANLGYTRVLAPIDGTVVAIVTEEGQTVNAVQSSPTIVKIAQLDTVTVEAQISEADVIRVEPGQDAYFTILGDPDRKFPGKLRSVEPAPESISDDDSRGGGTVGSDSQAVYYNGLFDVPNADGTLRIDMTANVNVVLGRIESALLIPLAALGERGRNGDYTVHIVDAEGRAVPRKVRIGMRSQIDAQVLSGLREGERVVIGEAAEPEVESSGFPPRPPQLNNGG